MDGEPRTALPAPFGSQRYCGRRKGRRRHFPTCAARPTSGNERLDLSWLEQREFGAPEKAAEAAVEGNQVAAERADGSGDPGIRDVVSRQVVSAAELPKRRPFASKLRDLDAWNGEQGVHKRNGISDRRRR